MENNSKDLKTSAASDEYGKKRGEKKIPKE